MPRGPRNKLRITKRNSAWVFRVACLCFLTAGPVLSSPAENIQDYRAGRSFQEALSQSIAGTIAGQPLKAIVGEVGSTAEIAILIDRRLNPDRVISVNLATMTRLQALRQIAARGHGDVSVLDNVVMLGPERSTRNLRTLVELRRTEAMKLDNRRALRKKRDISWDFIAEPREIIEQIGRDFEIAVQNPHVIPHDLWRGAQIPQVDPATAFSLVLTQFGFTFAWREEGRSIEILPEPEAAIIESTVRISRDAPTNLLALTRQRYPDTEVSQVRSTLRMSGRWEAIEGIRALAAGKEDPQRDKRQPMANQRFTMSASGVPAGAVLRKLVSAGNDVTWDQADAGLALDKPIDIDVQGATADELFRTICEQIGARYEIGTFRVRVFTK